MNLSTDDLVEVLEATWPAAAQRRDGPFLLKLSPGGGKRVTAARLLGEAFQPADLDRAEAAMRDAGQPPLFQLAPGQAALDTALAAHGYAVVDETLFMTCDLAPLCDIDVPRLTAFDIWPPLAVQQELWAEAGIGPDRLAVMARCTEPHRSLMGRDRDRVAGAGFVACHKSVAMVHALETRPAFRGRGVATRMMGQAARWAATRGARHMALAVTKANTGARTFYRGLGMAERPGYTYRIGTQE
ncbi:GNAT family N-acetyltransferase [Fluviibacterium sp. DFM31]|uniref:GNAT family N-acetyltransferase n=1 Tax=Meridianimarinicoccus marinus TaxID=3231483 RepID=A0ABV3L6Y9_9RHOB